MQGACIDAEVATAYAEHRLSADERLGVEEHIDACSSCRELISAVARLEWSQVGTADGAPEVGGVLPPGTRLGPYELEQPLDAGGMGLVYAAHDTRLDRRVAVKAVRELRGDPDQLLREARMMAQLAHPNVVAVYDVVEAHDQVFLAMELVVGRSVRQWLDAAPRSWQAIVDVFLAAGAGLAAAHAANIVHGDVKPANLLVGDDGRVRITDFGLSRAGEAQVELGVRGTPAYMAPEQREGTPCDVRGDQFAFCASLHEALFGAVPGRAPTKQPRVPRRLRRCLGRGQAADPRDRYPSMIELLRDLRATRSAWLRWTIGGVVVAAAIALLAFGVGERRGQRALCAAAAPRLTSPWDAEARGMVQRSFANTKLAYVAQTLAHVEANLDHWSDELDTARADACEAGTFHTGAPPERLAAVLDCLEDRTREGRALINQFREADATTVLNATGATEQLRSVAECTATPATRVVAPDSPMLQQVRELFARAHALMDSGKFRDALPLAREAVTIAEAIGDPGVQSGALVSLASAQARLSDYDTAMTNLQQALRLAEQAQDDRVRAQVWVNLVQIEYWRGHFDQVVFMKAAALGATERIGDLGLETEVMLNLGGALSQLGRTREAQGLFETAVQLRRKIYGQRDRRLAFALGSLGNAYSMQGNLDAGIAAHREALASVEAALGSTHPNTGVSHGNLGDDYIYALRAPEAVTELAQDVAIAEAADGPKHRDVAMALTDLGTAQLEAGQLEAAAASAERADAIWTTVNAKHPARAEALLARYLALQALGKPAAVSDLETALTLGAGLPPFERARIQLALGRASTGARAIELVKAAAAGFATSPLPLCQRELVAAKAWLVAHGSSP